MNDQNEQDLSMHNLSRRASFDAYFGSLMGMSVHPGATRDGARPLTVEAAVQTALAMLRERDDLVARGLL